MKRKIKSVLAASCQSVLALLLVLALQLSSVPRNISAKERPDDQRLAVISLLREAEKLATDKGVRDELARAIEILSADRDDRGGEVSFPGVGSPFHKILRHILDDPRGESPEFQEKIRAALKLVDDNHSPRDVAAIARVFDNKIADARGTTTTQQPGGKISPVVLEGLRQAEREAAARAEARKKAFEADRARFEPTAAALPEVLKAASVDLDGYLTASRQFVEAGPEKANPAEVERVNRKFAEPIRAAIARAVVLPGAGDILQATRSWRPALGGPGSGQPSDGGGNSSVGPQAASCCSTNRFEPPFEGLFSEGDLFSRAFRPGEIRQLAPSVRSAVAGAAHRLEASSRRFTVPASARHVSVTMNLGTNWVIGLSGLGYAHVWLGLDMNVTNAGGTVVCGAPRLEQDNQGTLAGGYLTLSDHRRVINITRTCVFDRSPGDPTDYVANVSASVDGTFFGLSGGYGHYFVDLGPVDVTTCP